MNKSSCFSALCISLFAFVGVSCSTDDLGTEEKKAPPVVSTNGSTRSISEAIEIANNALSMLADTVSESRSAVSRTVNKNDIKVVCSKGADSRTASGSNDTLLYVINYSNEQGFAVVSANRNTEPLLAVTEEGRYGNEDVMSNNGFQMFMKAAEKYVATSHESTIKLDSMLAAARPASASATAAAPGMLTRIISDTIRNTMYPRVQVKWGQGWPAGQYCPNKKAGCGIIAMAMAMSYLQRPAAIALTYPGASTSSILLNWQDMRNHIRATGSDTLTVCYDCTASSTAHDNLGVLCRQLGHYAQAQYNFLPKKETSTYYENVRDVFHGLGFIVDETRYYFSNCVRDRIGTGIVVVRGDDFYGEGGHMWIADGFIDMYINHYVFVSYNAGLTWDYVGVQTNNAVFNHYNWGWNGISNGYFLSNIFTPSQNGIYDNAWLVNSENYNFTTNVIYFNVR